MMSFDCDVVVVGGGPIGSTVAYLIAEEGFSVFIVEKKTQIGYPLQCAGILSSNIVDYNSLPDEVIINTVKGAFLHTENHILNVEKEDTVAYVIDRIAYDEFLLKRAIENGARIINQKAVDFDVEEGITYFSNGESIKSKVIIGCDGYHSNASEALGNVQSNFKATQMLVKIADENMKSFRDSDKAINDYADTYLLDEILPGFLWIIPTRNQCYRIGLFSNQTHKEQSEVLNKFLNDNFEFEVIEKYRGFIPIFNGENNIAKDRMILIGDAAGQIKPTSGGGLIIGFDACRIACGYVTDAIENDDIRILEGYQKKFNKTYLKEFNYQFKVQRTLNLLTDEDLDYLFLKLKENDGEKLISQYGDMDTQSTLVKEFIKRGLIFKIIPTFLFKKVVNIFGFR
jgi:geranylgeranyl reductase family protein